MPSNTLNGKAFEYACLCELRDAVEALGSKVCVTVNSQLRNAELAFNTVDVGERQNMLLAARTAAKLLLPLEPMLRTTSGSLVLSLMSDAAAIGVGGDVRDVLCVRNGERTIGFSCKHNHEALRHPRITEGKNFGRDWIGIDCSQDFMDAITPVTDSLIDMGKSGVEWRNVDDKIDGYYRPILAAYLDEIVRMCREDRRVPEKLLSYFFGANDFYKIIMKARLRTTTIEGFNMHGTLNAPYDGLRAMMHVPVIKMPARLLNAEFKENTKTTLILTFDGGWAISMRLHNKDKIARPTSLAWDVQLVGLPPSIYINTHSWDE